MKTALACAAIMLAWLSPAAAVEGPSAAGPIGGTDLRSGLMPPPGLYGGTVQLLAGTREFVDGRGREIFGLEKARLIKGLGGPFLYWVPDAQIFGGLLGVGGILPVGRLCGKLFAGSGRECLTGIGDPYIEVDWGRFFGTVRASKFEGAYSVPEGLGVMLGFGVVVPAGRFEHGDPLEQALSPGTGIWDFAPSLALTYTTAPVLADGTEFSAKFFWNNYLLNKKTDYRTGDLLNLDFAVTERIGRAQLGVAGNYAVQVQDDRFRGARIPPDGRRGELLQLGGVIAYDMPERATSLKLKATNTVHAENTVTFWAVVTSWVTKF